jgi:peptidoglycan/LPS O-acetylase OafA/YrhL
VFFAVLTTLRMLNADFAVVFPVFYLTLVGAAFALACVTFALIEAPFMALGRRVIVNLRRAPLPVSAIANAESVQGHGEPAVSKVGSQ